MTRDFTSETMEARRKWSIFQVGERKEHQFRILYTAKITFKNEHEIQIFLDEEKLRYFAIREHSLKQWPKEVSQT